jgi:hypothetical protein
MGGCGLNSSASGQGLVAGSYKHVTENLGFVKGVGSEGLCQ